MRGLKRLYRSPELKLFLRFSPTLSLSPCNPYELRSLYTAARAVIRYYTPVTSRIRRTPRDSRLCLVVACGGTGTWPAGCVVQANRARARSPRSPAPRWPRLRAIDILFKIQDDGDCSLLTPMRGKPLCPGPVESHRGTARRSLAPASIVALGGTSMGPWARASVRLLTLFSLTSRLPIRSPD